MNTDALPPSWVQPGQVLQGTYRITRRIAVGGMGVVFEAENIRLSQKRFAIKVLSPTAVQDPDAYLRFRREAEIVSALGHPNIINVIDFNELPGGPPYIIMEYLDGEDLKNLMQRRGRLPLRMLTRIVEQTGDALQVAHDQGIVHRDLKPGNIFLAKQRNRSFLIKLLDFGISKIRHGQSVVTQNLMLLGTPYYMSPEQARGQMNDVDHRSDIFALGSIMYRGLTGELPFDAPEMPGVMFKVCFERPRPVRELSPGLPVEVDEVLARAMAKDKTERYQRVEDLVHDFQEVMKGLPDGTWYGPEGRQEAHESSELEVGSVEASDELSDLTQQTPSQPSRPLHGAAAWLNHLKTQPGSPAVLADSGGSSSTESPVATPQHDRSPAAGGEASVRMAEGELEPIHQRAPRRIRGPEVSPSPANLSERSASSPARSQAPLDAFQTDETPASGTAASAPVKDLGRTPERDWTGPEPDLPRSVPPLFTHPGPAQAPSWQGGTASDARWPGQDLDSEEIESQDIELADELHDAGQALLGQVDEPEDREDLSAAAASDPLALGGSRSMPGPAWAPNDPGFQDASGPQDVEQGGSASGEQTPSPSTLEDSVGEVPSIASRSRRRFSKRSILVTSGALLSTLVLGFLLLYAFDRPGTRDTASRPPEGPRHAVDPSPTAQPLRREPRSPGSAAPKTVAARPVRIRLHLNPTAARVLVNGEERFEDPLVITPSSERTATLRIEAPGFLAHEEVLTLYEDQELEVTLRRAPVAVSAARPAPTGSADAKKPSKPIPGPQPTTGTSTTTTASRGTPSVVDPDKDRAAAPRPAEKTTRHSTQKRKNKEEEFLFQDL